MVKIELGKKDLIWVGLIVVIFVAGVGMASWVDVPVYHEASQIKVNLDGSDLNLNEALAQVRSEVSSGSLDCRVKSQEGKNENVCCNSDEFAMGINQPKSDSRAFWSNVRCVQFEGMGSVGTQEIMCCK